MQVQPSRSANEMTRHDFDRAGPGKSLADDQHQRNDQRGGMSEAGEHRRLGDGTANVSNNQGAEGNDVVPHPSPQEKGKDPKE